MKDNVLLAVLRDVLVKDRKRSFIIISVSVIYTIAQTLAFADYLHFDAVINAKNAEILRGTHVSELGRYEPKYRNGDLYDITGSVIEKGGGAPSQVISGNQRLPVDQMLYPGVKLKVIPGANAFEPASTEVTSTAQRLTITGKGPVWVKVTDGYPGRRIQRTGHISRRTSSYDIYLPHDSQYERLTADQAKYIAFTFDDGPSSGYTLQVLNVLKANNVKGTFFVVGSRAEHYPWLIRAIVKGGHTIGNHTYSHVELTKVDETRVFNELSQTQAIVRSVGGGNMRFFRAPYGSYNGIVTAKADQLDYTQVFWNIDTRDWTGLSAQRIYVQTLGNLRPGAVVLMHDGGGKRAETVKALAMLLPRLKELGYTVVGMDEMMRLIEEKRAQRTTSVNGMKK